MKKSFFAKSGQEKSLILCALRGLLAALLTLFALAALFSAIGLSLDDPGKYTKIFAFASLFAAAFAGGFTSARKKGGATLLCGAATSIFLLALIALAALCFSLAINVSLFAVCSAFVLLCSVLGANIGLSLHGEKKKRKHAKNRA
jgi:putative membrane protein (TIGR04086 family)